MTCYPSWSFLREMADLSPIVTGHSNLHAEKRRMPLWGFARLAGNGEARK
jgi:hypothetical protein